MDIYHVVHDIVNDPDFSILKTAKGVANVADKIVTIAEIAGAFVRRLEAAHYELNPSTGEYFVVSDDPDQKPEEVTGYH